MRLSIPGADEHGGPLGDPTYGTQLAPFSILGVAPEGTLAVTYEIISGAYEDGEPYELRKPTYSVADLGYGPLDPRNFTAADFPSSYQILWIDGCVSYNYYEKDYIPLKQGGTTNLDLITNGIEAPSWRSGTANAQFLTTLLTESASYRDLLLAAEDTEAMRV